MKQLKLVCTFLFALLVLACSNQQTYEAIQDDRLRECQKLPPAAADKCMQQHDLPYEDYQREREEALKK